MILFKLTNSSLHFQGHPVAKLENSVTNPSTLFTSPRMIVLEQFL